MNIPHYPDLEIIQATNKRIRWIVLLLVITLFFSLPTVWAAKTPQQFLDYCLNNTSQCALSVNHVTQGWERHHNADRPQVIASVFKIIPLIAYAEAVVDGVIDRNHKITKEDWGRYFVGGDGGALNSAWIRLGMPNTLTVDDLASAMIQESDNAAPDWLLNELGARRLNQVIKVHVRGFHDQIASVNAMFVTRGQNPNDLGSGNRIPKDYSDFGNADYQKEVRQAFRNLAKPTFVQNARQVTCSTLPWETPPGCNRSYKTTVANQRELNERFFMRSTTRTYNGLMADILSLTHFRPAVSDIIRDHLEFRLSNPGFFAFSRHGGKQGNLLPHDILTWTTYLESEATRDQVVVTIFMQNLPSGLLNADDLARFAQEILLNPSFGQIVQDTIPVDAPMPELILESTRFWHKKWYNGDNLLVKILVRNAGTAMNAQRVPVALFISDDTELDPQDQRVATILLSKIRPGLASLRLLFAGRLPPLVDKYALVVVDPDEIIPESVEDNNMAYQRIR